MAICLYCWCLSIPPRQGGLGTLQKGGPILKELGARQASQSAHLHAQRSAQKTDGGDNQPALAAPQQLEHLDRGGMGVGRSGLEWMSQLESRLRWMHVETLLMPPPAQPSSCSQGLHPTFSTTLLRRM